MIEWLSSFEPETIGFMGLGALLVLLMLRVNVALSMMIVAIFGYGLIRDFDASLNRLGQDGFTAPNSFSLSVIPLFVLMGLLLSESGLGKDAYVALDRFTERIQGGLSVATIGASAMFASVNGSAVASATTMSVVAVPEMRKYNYDDGLAAASVTVGGTLGALIPPSAVLVLYGILTEEPIGDLLLAGIIPGILMAGSLMLGAWVMVKRNPEIAPPTTKPESERIRKRDAVKLVWAIPVIFGISMGGILLGWFTPTEAGGAGAFLALMYGILTRRLSWSGFVQALSGTVRTSALIFLLLIGGQLFGFFLAISRIPNLVGDFVGDLNTAPWVIMIAIYVVYFVLGAMMDEIAILVIMTPIIYPIVTGQLEYSGVWFGIISTMMLLTGLVTPPVGIITFVVAGVTKIPLTTVFRGILPFMIPMSIVILLVILIPEIATFLPDAAR
jgi:tripartite ATP-independent transporter DctM subunit